MTPEPAREKLRQAAIAFVAIFDHPYDEDNYVNAVASLEVAAKAFADDVLKSKLEVATEALEEVSRCFQSVIGACDEIRMTQMVEAAIEKIHGQTKTPPGK